MTGNLKNISDSRIRYIVSKGPKYRFPSRIDLKPEDHWSCIANQIAEDMLKTAVIEEKKFKNIEYK